MSIHRPVTLAAAAVLSATLATGGSLGTADASPDAGEHRASGAGTLIYIKGHNVWLAQGDGSSARALTTDGTKTRPYASPSQADDGTIAVGRLDEIIRMDQSGHVLNRMNPAPLPSSVSGHPVDGNLQEVAISPDGSLIAYTMTKFLNPPGAEPGYRSATGYTAAGSFTPSGPRGTTYFEDPSWIGSTRTLQGGGYGSQVMIDELGPGDPVHWFDDEDVYPLSTDLGNSELSADGRYLAAVRGFGTEAFIIWYGVSGDATSGPPPAVPTPLCEIGPTTITDPTWAPDSDSLAWVESDGIWVRSGADDCSVPSDLLIPGGSQPDWSPAPLDPPEHADDQVENVQRPSITGPPRVGRTLTADPGRWSPGSVRTTVQWKRNGAAVRGADERRYRLTAKDRGKRITVTVTATKNGWESATATSAPVQVRS